MRRSKMDPANGHAHGALPQLLASPRFRPRWPTPPYRPLWMDKPWPIYGPLWIFYSRKAGRVVRVRGDINYYTWLLLECDPAVVEMCERPFAVEIKMNGQWRRAEVAVWVRRKDGQQAFISSVYRGQVSSASNSVARRHHECLTEWATRTGAPLLIFSDQTIWREPQLLSNLACLVRFLGKCHGPIDPELGLLVTRAVKARGRITLGEIERTFSRYTLTAIRAAVFEKLFLGILQTSLSKSRLCAATELALA